MLHFVHIITVFPSTPTSVGSSHQYDIQNSEPRIRKLFPELSLRWGFWKYQKDCNELSNTCRYNWWFDLCYLPREPCIQCIHQLCGFFRAELFNELPMYCEHFHAGWCSVLKVAKQNTFIQIFLLDSKLFLIQIQTIHPFRIMPEPSSIIQRAGAFRGGYFVLS